MNNKKLNKSQYIKDKFRYPTVDDFKNREVKFEKYLKNIFTKRLCPDKSANNFE